MSLMKKSLKTRPVCKVTFCLPSNMVDGARSVHLAGDFNQWSTHSHPMKQKKDGSFSITLDLEQGSEYQFRYVIDQERWENDDQADAYLPSPLNAAVENSIVRT